MSEKWIRWEPIKNLARKYYIESIAESIEDPFKVILSDAGNKGKNVLISFSNGVRAYRSTDKPYALDTIHFLVKTYDKDFYVDWAFFKIENSEYLKWLSEKSCGISDYQHLIHFCILAADSIVDIAVDYEPTITFLE